MAGSDTRGPPQHPASKGNGSGTGMAPTPKPNAVNGQAGLRYLQGYPAALQQQVQQLVEQGRLAEHVHQRFPETHTVRSERALYDYVQALKNERLRSSPPLSKVVFDPKLQVLHKALGTHTAVSRVQGTQLKAKREIRIASVFKEAPAAFLKMIVVHELAHLKEREHGKAFYALCEHLEPDYHALELGTRLWLTALEQSPSKL
jgi:predicted metal-dependent hydrolase